MQTFVSQAPTPLPSPSHPTSPVSTSETGNRHVPSLSAKKGQSVSRPMAFHVFSEQQQGGHEYDEANPFIATFCDT